LTTNTLNNLVTLVICTRNRANLLDKCLQSISLQNNNLIPVFIIDSSTDNTQLIVNKWRKSINNLSYCYEPSTGLGFARNRILEECSSKYIHYIDDDTKLPSTFFQSLLNFITIHNPDAYTGKIIASFEYKRPKWYKNNYLTGSNTNLKTGILNHGFLMGGNLGIKTEILKLVGGFPLDFGKSSFMYCDETYIQYKLQKMGRKLHYCEEIVIQHFGNDDTVIKILKIYYHQCLSIIKLKDTLNIKKSSFRMVLSSSKQFIKSLFKGFYLIFLKKNYYYQNWIIDLGKPLINIYLHLAMVH
jgi:glycosyltransferase involved in cell wall biosynthesis